MTIQDVLKLNVKISGECRGSENKKENLLKIWWFLLFFEENCKKKKQKIFTKELKTTLKLLHLSKNIIRDKNCKT